VKAILEYELPEDQIEFDLATSASKIHSVLWDLDQWLRSKTKYAPDGTSEGELKAYYACRDQLRELINENNINL
jgi:hypothetical protein